MLRNVADNRVNIGRYKMFDVVQYGSFCDFVMFNLLRLMSVMSSLICFYFSTFKLTRNYGNY